MNLHQLKLFVTVVERGSFTRAGEELFITPSALSIQVRRLEQSLGISLLRRISGGVAPTPAGLELHKLGKAMLELEDAAQSRMAELKTGAAGSIRIGVSRIGPLYYLADVLRDWSAAYPGASVTVRFDRREHVAEALVRGSLDLGLEWGAIAWEGVVNETLRDEPFVLIVAPDHPLARRGVITREEFASAPFIALDYGLGTPGFAELNLGGGWHPNTIMRLPSMEAVKRLVEAGLGISVIARVAARRELEANQLACVELESLEVHRPLVLCRPRGPFQSPAAETFHGFLSAHPLLRQEP